MSEDIRITTYAERPELLDRVYELRDTWPAFMSGDPVANALFWQVAPAFPHLNVVATHDGRPVARGRAIPFAGEVDGRRGPLPDGGWDRVLAWGMSDRLDGVRPDTVSALEVAIDSDHLGCGLSARMLGALRDAAAVAGYDTLVAPVRPTRKHEYPTMPIADYARQVRNDGLPVDPWLRVHVRAGGRIENVAAASMVIAGSVAQWRTWTGLRFDRSGPVLVPQALVPVHCDAAQGHAVYVEPNVWMTHAL